MNPVVVDCSVTIAWYFQDESDIYAVNVLKTITHFEICVPSIWTLEIANALLVGLRRQRITNANIHQILKFLNDLTINIDDEVSLDSFVFNNILSLAKEQNLSSYDASYLELAIRYGCPIATLDKKLKKAARNLGVKLFMEK